MYFIFVLLFLSFWIFQLIFLFLIFILPYRPRQKVSQTHIQTMTSIFFSQTLPSIKRNAMQDNITKYNEILQRLHVHSVALQPSQLGYVLLRCQCDYAHLVPPTLSILVTQKSWAAHNHLFIQLLNPVFQFLNKAINIKCHSLGSSRSDSSIKATGHAFSKNFLVQA